ncbi:hypothetical protein C357_04682 [Citreicella sp. 357]|nr:hypothetical protein C357_04682 [Citreicella sp. 357]
MHPFPDPRDARPYRGEDVIVSTGKAGCDRRISRADDGAPCGCCKRTPTHGIRMFADPIIAVVHAGFTVGFEEDGR